MEPFFAQSSIRFVVWASRPQSSAFMISIVMKSTKMHCISHKRCGLDPTIYSDCDSPSFPLLAGDQGQDLLVRLAGVVRVLRYRDKDEIATVTASEVAKLYIDRFSNIAADNSLSTFSTFRKARDLLERKLYLKIYHNAATPSDIPIFFPSSYVLP